MYNKHMIIWKGKGFIIALVAFFSLLVTELSVEYLFSNEQYYQEHGWPKLFGFWLTAIITYALSLTFLKTHKRLVVDQKTGEKITLSNSPTLFFIDIKYLPIVFFVLGVVFFFIRD